MAATGSTAAAAAAARPEVLQLNLKALRKHDGSILDVLDTAAHVVVYRFDTATNGWV